MLIILEGPDGAGKSTLANALIEVIATTFPHEKIELRKAGPPPPNAHPLDLYETPLLHYRPGVYDASRPRHIVCDRWHVGEWIYPALLGRSTRADAPAWLHLDLFLQSRGALLVYVTETAAVLARTLTERGDDLVSPEQSSILVKRYENELALSRIPRYTTGRDNPFAVADIIAQARHLEAKAAPIGHFVTYVGPPEPRYLILGDVRHALSKVDLSKLPADATRGYGPAFGPLPGTSGHYLLRHLPKRLLYAGVGLANACDVDAVDDLRQTLNWPATVALGVNAWRALAGSGVGPIGAAPHPQYVLRFHNRHGYSYGQVIAAALEGKNELAWRP